MLPNESIRVIARVIARKKLYSADFERTAPSPLLLGIHRLTKENDRGILL